MMRLVVDTNVLMTFFWKNSKTRKLIMLGNSLELFSPEFALDEIKKHKDEILKKTNISEEEFNVIRIELAISIKFYPVIFYKDFLKQSLDISPDKNDIDFFALALKLDLPIWSNDKNLKNPDMIKIISTKELLQSY